MAKSTTGHKMSLLDYQDHILSRLVHADAVLTLLRMAEDPPSQELMLDAAGAVQDMLQQAKDSFLAMGEMLKEADRG